MQGVFGVFGLTARPKLDACILLVIANYALDNLWVLINSIANKALQILGRCVRWKSTNVNATLSSKRMCDNAVLFGGIPRLHWQFMPLKLDSIRFQTRLRMFGIAEFQISVVPFVSNFATRYVNFWVWVSFEDLIAYKRHELIFIRVLWQVLNKDFIRPWFFSGSFLGGWCDNAIGGRRWRFLQRWRRRE